MAQGEKSGEPKTSIKEQLTAQGDQQNSNLERQLTSTSSGEGQRSSTSSGQTQIQSTSSGEGKRPSTSSGEGQGSSSSSGLLQMPSTSSGEGKRPSTSSIERTPDMENHEDLPVIDRPSSRLSHGDSAVMKQMQKDVADIKKAVTTILNTLIVQEEVVVESVEDFIPEKIKNQEMMDQLNEQLESDEEFRKKLIMVLAKLKDGGDLPSITRLVMRSILTNGIMSKYSLTGQRGKTPFKGTRTCKVILKALKRATKNRFPVKDYEFEIAEVLRNAPNCPGGVNFLKKNANKKRRSTVEDSDSN